ncbi:MAG: rhomboid family intramembrane serine protease [Elusimicrobia bacterium]|nr:rhomboid family intramembrane serine protease [Elusimicrobiota bacterium]MDE2237463.1 rhomboid family intramembrane serine protease [Elusimicrobiota bacterium]MDE2424594.1 rhomboid family intramembrane serine protease [Elusimicrobiota bacterium]
MSEVFSHEPMSLRRMPPAVKALIVANVAVFALSYLAGNGFYDTFGLVPRDVLGRWWLWQPATYLFIHGGFMHLLFNMFALWMFGTPVEAQWGARDFLKYYFLCGLGAAAASVAMSPHSGIPVIGASGSIYGLLVAFAMLYPDAVIYLYFFIPVRAAHVAILFGFIEFFAGTSGATPGIARFAHLGGMVTGYLYLRWWWVVKIRAAASLRGMGARRSPSFPSPSRWRRPARSRPKPEEGEQPQMAEIDRILDKILANGLDSLTEEEKEIMRKYSDKRLQ